MARITKDEHYLGIALAVSKRSTCLKRHYGCVIVKDDTIIATGYNGSPRDEEVIGYYEDMNPVPCGICARMLKNAGIVRVVSRRGDVCL